jgi:hypothetical protein
MSTLLGFAVPGQPESATEVPFEEGTVVSGSLLMPQGVTQTRSIGPDGTITHVLPGLVYNEVDSVVPSTLLHFTRPTAINVSLTIDFQRCRRLETISFPVLQRCVTMIVIHNSALTTLFLPRLAAISGSLTIQNNGLLESLVLSSLQMIRQGTVLISGNPTLTTLSFPELVFFPNTGFGVTNNSALASVSCPKLRTAWNITLSGMNAFTTLDMSAVEFAGAITVGTLPLLTTLSLPALQSMYNLALTTCIGLTTCSFPSLTHVLGNQVNNNIGFIISGCTSLATVSVPSLIEACLISLTGPDVLTTLSFPALTGIRVYTFPSGASGGTLVVATHASLTTLSLPLCTLIEGTGGMVVSGCGALTTINIASLQRCLGPITCNSSNGAISTVNFPPAGTLLQVGGNVHFGSQALNEASVDAILVSLASLDGTNGTTAYGAGRTVTLNGGTNAAPSATGTAARAVLLGRGATVNVN